MTITTYTKFHIAFALIAVTSACVIQTDAPSPSSGPEPELIQTLPDGLETEDEQLFQMDTATAIFAMPVAHNPGHSVLGVLTDGEGRRELRYDDGVGSEVVLADAAWHMPPVGVAGDAGSAVVCYNRFSSSSAPIPSAGVGLFCRFNNGNSWEAELQVAPNVTAAWLQSVARQPDGSFLLTFYTDDGWFVAPAQDHHGAWEVALIGGVLGEPYLVQHGCDDIE